MTVRVAKYSDIPAIVEIMTWAHQRSRDAAGTTFDEIEAKQLLMRCIQRHGHRNYLGSLVLVSERETAINGFVIGLLDVVYPCLKELKVTDLLFIVNDQVRAVDTRCMVQALIEWGRSNPRVVKVLLGATDDLADWTRVQRLYQKCGLSQCGGLFRIDFDRGDMQQEAS